ncbi:MAG: ribosome silencing factor [Bacteroidia bacterium]
MPTRLKLVLSALKEKKAEDIIALHLNRLPNAICDYFVVATVESPIQGRTIVDYLLSLVKNHKDTPPRVEGYDTEGWILVDLGDVILHLFLPQVRSYYQLEDLWADTLIPLENVGA